MTNLTKIAALPMAGGAMAALPKSEVKAEKYRELREALAAFQAAAAKTAEWIEKEYRPKFEASTMPDKVWLDGVVFSDAYNDTKWAFECACTPQVIASLLADIDAAGGGE